MKWEMEVDEIEAVLEKIWDLHDKLSDAIHSISRAHFLNSIKNPAQRPDEFGFNRKKKSADGDPENKSGSGFVFVKGFRVDDDDVAVLEAKSLYSIRTALENLEDQLEFFHVSAEIVNLYITFTCIFLFSASLAPIWWLVNFLLIWLRVMRMFLI